MLTTVSIPAYASARQTPYSGTGIRWVTVNSSLRMAAETASVSESVPAAVTETEKTAETSASETSQTAASTGSETRESSAETKESAANKLNKAAETESETASESETVIKNGWDSDGAFKIYYINGALAKGVQKIADNKGTAAYYYFDDKGHMCIGWQSVKDSSGKVLKYYFGADGKAYTGEQNIGGNWYFFSTDTAVMQTGFQKIVLQDKSTKTCYYNPADGIRLQGFQKIDGYSYYFKYGSGDMKRGFANITITVNNRKKKIKVYYSEENGRMLYGMQTIAGVKYYFNRKTGAMEWKVRRYQNPAGYYQIQSKSIVLKNRGRYKKGYTLNIGFEGLKTAWVMRKLGISDGVGMGYAGGAYYSSYVRSAVARFQRRHGLKANGKVDLATWKAMGYSERQWYRLDSYASPIAVNENSSRKDCINAMIRRAYKYLGDDYVIGASSAPGLGCDCSGLVMQSLFAAGIDLSPINPIRHAFPGFEYESANIWRTKKLKHVKYSKRKRGDIIIYTNASHSTVIHSAIYLGKNRVIESWPNTVRISYIKSSIHPYVLGVVRPFQ